MRVVVGLGALVLVACGKGSDKAETPKDPAQAALEPDVAALWDVEIERRGAEVDAGIAETMSLDEYRAHVRARRAERARVIDDARRGAVPSLSDEERRELDDRLREDDEDPDGAIPWAKARVQLRSAP